MAEFVEQSLEELVPVFEQLNATQLLSEKEVNLLVKRCRRYDYRLQKSHKKPEDYLNYGEYLSDLLDLLVERRKAIGYNHKKEIIEFAIKRKAAGIYRRLCERFQGKLDYWMRFIHFTSSRNMKAQTSKAFIQAMQMHPRSLELRIKAARWEWEENKSVDNARRGLQLALRLHPESVHLWATLFEIELDYVRKIKRRRQILLEQKKEGGKGDEDEAVAEPSTPAATDAVLQLRVAEIVLEQGVESIGALKAEEREGKMSELLVLLWHACLTLDASDADAARVRATLEERMAAQPDATIKWRVEVEKKLAEGEDLMDALASKDWSVAAIEELRWAVRLLQEKADKDEDKVAFSKARELLYLIVSRSECTEDECEEWARGVEELEGEEQRTTIQKAIERFPRRALFWRLALEWDMKQGLEGEQGVIKHAESINKALEKARDDDDSEEAVKLYRQAIDIAIEHFPATAEKVFRSSLDSSVGDTHRALKQLRVDYLLSMVEDEENEEQRAKKWTGVERELRALVQRRPNSIEFYVHLGEALLGLAATCSKGTTRAAAIDALVDEALSAAVAEHPDSDDAWIASAHKCMAKEQEDYTPNACTLPHCSTTREILRHMPTCNGNCPYVYCKSSRQILFHWKSCQKQDCTICRPLVTAYVTNQEARTSDQGDAGSPLSPSLGMGGSGNQLSPSLPVQQQMVNVTGGRGMGINSPNDGAAANLPNWSRPEQPLTNKDWHSDVTDDLRHNLVGKLVKAVFPSPNPVDLHDQRIQDLIEYARAIEMEMFENADDKEDYYRMLAERTLEIKMKQQEKIQKRLSESRENGSEMEASVKSEMPTSTNRLERERLWNSLLPILNLKKGEPDDFPCSVNRMGGGGWNPALVKKEEMDDSPRSANGMGSGGWNPALVKEEPGTCQSSSSTTAHPTTSTGVITPKRELNTPPPGTEYVHELAELQRYLKPILSELCKTEDALPFKLPVDPYLLNIPDYFDIVKRPMDLSTMAKKLRKGLYTNPWQFCDDMWLMFDNAWLYNKKTSKVYKHSIKLSELFTEKIKPVMVNMGYCCGNDLFFTPLALFCYGATMCMIGREQSYYCYETTSNAYGVVVSETYTYCVKCYEALPEEGISLSENPNDKSSMVPKSDFKMARNNVIEPEPFEHCKYCGRRWHKICALHDKKVLRRGQ